MVMIIGHRGACGYEPENTLRSFEKAITLGVHMVELDVHVCRSGELVVIHDNRLERTTNGKGLVADADFDMLAGLDAGGGEHIPLLSEVLALVNRRVPINIELKGEHTAGPVHELIGRAIAESGYAVDDFMVSSFNHYELMRFSGLNAAVKTGALTEGVPLGYAEFAERLGAYSVNAGLDFINETFILDAHRRRLKVFVYTVNHPEDIKRMINVGVDGIFTNYPDRALQ